MWILKEKKLSTAYTKGSKNEVCNKGDLKGTARNRIKRMSFCREAYQC